MLCVLYYFYVRRVAAALLGRPIPGIRTKKSKKMRQSSFYKTALASCIIYIGDGGFHLQNECYATCAAAVACGIVYILLHTYVSLQITQGWRFAAPLNGHRSRCSSTQMQVG